MACHCSHYMLYMAWQQMLLCKLWICLLATGPGLSVVSLPQRQGLAPGACCSWSRQRDGLSLLTLYAVHGLAADAALQAVDMLVGNGPWTVYSQPAPEAGPAARGLLFIAMAVVRSVIVYNICCTWPGSRCCSASCRGACWQRTDSWNSVLLGTGNGICPACLQVLFCKLSREQRDIYRSYLSSKEVEEIVQGVCLQPGRHSSLACCLQLCCLYCVVGGPTLCVRAGRWACRDASTHLDSTPPQTLA